MNRHARITLYTLVVVVVCACLWTIRGTPTPTRGGRWNAADAPRVSRSGVDNVGDDVPTGSLPGADDGHPQVQVDRELDPEVAQESSRDVVSLLSECARYYDAEEVSRRTDLVSLALLWKLLHDPNAINELIQVLRTPNTPFDLWMTGVTALGQVRSASARAFLLSSLAPGQLDDERRHRILLALGQEDLGCNELDRVLHDWTKGRIETGALTICYPIPDGVGLYDDTWRVLSGLVRSEQDPLVRADMLSLLVMNDASLRRPESPGHARQDRRVREGAFELVQDCLKGERDRGCWDAALMGMGYLDDPSVEAFLASVVEGTLQVPDKKIRVVAMESLGYQSSKTRAAQLYPLLLRDSDPEIRSNAIARLPARTREDALRWRDFWIAALKDSSPIVRRRAVVRLASLGELAYAELDHVALNDPDPIVRDEAKKQVKQLEAGKYIVLPWARDVHKVRVQALPRR